MSYRAFVFFCALIVVATFRDTAHADDKSTAKPIPAEIKAVMEKPLYKSGVWGLLVVDLDSGEVIYDLHADRKMMTGSVRETIKRPMGNPPLKELMESGGSMYGMQTFEMHIKELIRAGIVEREVGRAAMGF